MPTRRALPFLVTISMLSPTRRRRRPRSTRRCSPSIGSDPAGSTAGSRRPAGRSRCRCIAAGMCRCCQRSGNRRALDRMGRDRMCPDSRRSPPLCRPRTGSRTCPRCKGLTHSTSYHPRNCFPRRCNRPARRSRIHSRRRSSARRRPRIGCHSGMLRPAQRCHDAPLHRTDRDGLPPAARLPRPTRVRVVAVSQVAPVLWSRYRIADRPQDIPFLGRSTLVRQHFTSCIAGPATYDQATTTSTSLEADSPSAR
jgi:hypothetical protein